MARPNTRQTTVGLVVHGVGDDTTYSKGIVWCYGEHPPTTLETQDYEWVTLATDVPDTIETIVDWWSGELETNAVDISIAWPDPLVAKYLMSVQDRSKEYLEFDLSKTATTLYLEGPGRNDYEGKAIWVGDEVIYLATRTLDGTYIDCVRGYYGTRPQAQLAGALVYSRPQYLRYREATLIEYDWFADTVTVLVRCYVDTIRDNGNSITVGTVELMTLLEQGTLNRSAPKIPVTGTLIPLGGLGLALDTTIAFESEILRDDGYVWLQLEDTAINGFYDASAKTLTTALPPAAVWADAPTIEAEDENIVSEFSGTGYELFYVTRAYLPDERTFSSSKALDFQHYRHPIGLYYAFLRSGVDPSEPQDAWQSRYGMGIPVEWCDHQGILDLVAATQDATIDDLLIGWDGEPITMGDIWQMLCHPYGFLLAPKKDGTIGFSRLRGLDIQTFVNADIVNILPDNIRQDPRFEGAFSAVVAKIGEKPWRKPETVTAASREGIRTDATRKAIFDTARELVYDFRTQYSGKQRDTIVSTLIGRLLQGIQSVNQIQIDVLDDDDLVPGAKNFDLGSWVRVQCLDPITQLPALQTKSWVDLATGELVDIGSDARFCGIIVGRQYTIETGVWTLTLLMQSGRSTQLARFRAPSAIIDTAVDELVTLDLTFGSDDNERFVVGDVVDICNPDGTVYVAGATITDIPVPGTLELSSVGAIAGGLIRLSTYSSYGIGGDPLNAGVRAYVFVADNTETIIGAVKADLYG